MKQVFLSILAICMGIAALALSWSPRGGTDAADRAALSRLSTDLAETQVRFDQLAARLDRIEGATTSRAHPASPVTAKRFDELEETARLAERVARLEETLARLADSKARPSQPQTRETSPSTLSDAEVMKAITMWTEMARNAAAEKDRLQALRNLRGANLPDGTDARLAVVDDMVRLAESSSDPEVRADVWRQLSRDREVDGVPAARRASERSRGQGSRRSRRDPGRFPSRRKRPASPSARRRERPEHEGRSQA